MSAPDHNTRENLANRVATGTGRSAPPDPTFVSLLENQRDLYVTLLELGREQRELIARNETEALLSLLARRQGVVDRLTQVDAALIRCRDEWVEHYQSLGSEARDRVDALVQEIQDMLGAVMQMDREDVEALAEQKARVGNELARMPTQRQVNAAYGGTGSQSNRFVDQTDEAG